MEKPRIHLNSDSQKLLHEVAVANRPDSRLKPSSVWIAIILHTKKRVKDVKQERDFCWMKCHPRITIRTIKYEYFAQHPLEDLELQHRNYIPNEDMQVKELRNYDRYKDNVIVLYAFEISEDGLRNGNRDAKIRELSPPVSEYAESVILSEAENEEEYQDVIGTVEDTYNESASEEDSDDEWADGKDSKDCTTTNTSIRVGNKGTGAAAAWEVTNIEDKMEDTITAVFDQQGWVLEQLREFELVVDEDEKKSLLKAVLVHLYPRLEQYKDEQLTYWDFLARHYWPPSAIAQPGFKLWKMARKLFREAQTGSRQIEQNGETQQQDSSHKQATETEPDHSETDTKGNKKRKLVSRPKSRKREKQVSPRAIEVSNNEESDPNNEGYQSSSLSGSEGAQKWSRKRQKRNPALEKYKRHRAEKVAKRDQRRDDSIGCLEKTTDEAQPVEAQPINGNKVHGHAGTGEIAYRTILLSADRRLLPHEPLEPRVATFLEAERHRANGLLDEEAACQTKENGLVNQSCRSTPTLPPTQLAEHTLSRCLSPPCLGWLDTNPSAGLFEASTTQYKSSSPLPNMEPSLQYDGSNPDGPVLREVIPFHSSVEFLEEDEDNAGFALPNFEIDQAYDADIDLSATGLA